MRGSALTKERVGKAATLLRLSLEHRPIALDQRLLTFLSNIKYTNAHRQV